jgi:hypothetical protein
MLAGVAAFIAYARLFVRPIAPAPLSPFRVATGIVVLGALAFTGFVRVWYQLTHVR